MTKLVAVCGSRRAGSHTRTALEHALRAAENAGAETDFVDLGVVDLPLFHPDEELDEQGEAADLVRWVREADGVILGSPVYHGSYSSAFRNFHDYCSSDEYEATAVGLLAVAGGASYGSTLDHMRITVRGVYGQVVPEQVGIPNAYEQFDADGEFVDDDLRSRTEALGRAVVRAARRLSVTDSEPVPADD